MCSQPKNVKNVFNFLKIGNYKKKISGYEFFGLQRPDVIKQLQAKVSRKRKCGGDIQEPGPIYDTKKKKNVSQYPLLDKVANIKTRDAGPTTETAKHSNTRDGKVYII